MEKPVELLNDNSYKGERLLYPQYENAIGIISFFGY